MLPTLVKHIKQHSVYFTGGKQDYAHTHMCVCRAEVIEEYMQAKRSGELLFGLIMLS